MYGMWRALSRRHVHGLRFQPPATGGIHRIAGGVAQEPADAQSRHAAPRVAFVPLLKPRLHVTLHPVAVIAHQVGELVQHGVAEVVEHAAQDREVRYRYGLMGASVGHCLMSDIVRVVGPNEEGISI